MAAKILSFLALCTVAQMSACAVIPEKTVYPIKLINDTEFEMFLRLRANPYRTRLFALKNDFDYGKVMDFLDYMLEYRIIHSPTEAFMCAIEMFYFLIKDDTSFTKSEWKSFFCNTTDGVCDLDRFSAVLEEPQPSESNLQKFREEIGTILRPELIDRIISFMDDASTNYTENFKILLRSWKVKSRSRLIVPAFDVKSIDFSKVKFLNSKNNEDNANTF